MGNDLDIELDFGKHSRRRKRKTRKNMLLNLLIWIVELIAVIALARLVVELGIEKTNMNGDSMKPVLESGDAVVVNKAAYWIGTPKRFDVVVFRQNSYEHDYYEIRRVIGLPGDTVWISNGKVYINGEECDCVEVSEPVKIAGLAEKPLVLEEDEYFLLGDNRNNSEDSRYANIGNVMKNDIVGKAWFKTDPFAFISRLNRKKEK